MVRWLQVCYPQGTDDNGCGDVGDACNGERGCCDGLPCIGPDARRIWYPQGTLDKGCGDLDEACNNGRGCCDGLSCIGPDSRRTCVSQ
ncbi:hypothetical protein FIBSPDRAFT_318266 [Athelia psychrophila]|uniref:Uncharacterized protein n=1 Tax=Athelia psychrophila TaxID=1759441 RepID=A0A167WTD9_9AGAM|nr:hypothetical protein FIBSPDRAFT_318266 [Fibularhizoctonia sp. CBS 109695]